VASGRITSEIYEGEHWNGLGGTATFVDVAWETWVEDWERLDIPTLKGVVPEVAWDRLEASGVIVPGSALTVLEELWDEHLESIGR
jgi:hypothetical protein